MKKKHAKRILGRKIGPRQALLRGLTSALLLHGSIVTTEAKAKELRLFCEPLITKAKAGDSLHIRRQLLSALGHKADVERILEVGKANAKRPGGYLRLTHLQPRYQDNAAQMRVDFVDAA